MPVSSTATFQRSALVNSINENTSGAIFFMLAIIVHYKNSPTPLTRSPPITFLLVLNEPLQYQYFIFGIQICQPDHK